MKCLNCGITIVGKREGAKYCSPRCRKQASRIGSVTDNVTLSGPRVTDKFEFYTITKARKALHGKVQEEDSKSDKRTALYWYEVPLGAVPIMKKEWPAKPDYMNGRQYFLWWKNEFEEGKDGPVILNPFPVYDNIKVVPMRSGMGI